MKYSYDYPRPTVTVDAIITKIILTEILLIQRKNEPFKNFWALPGGFVEMNESLEEAVAREVLEETNLQIIEFQQFKTFGDVNRDPRGRTITVVFYSHINETLIPKAGDDAENCKWFEISDLPKLAFDHEKIINEYIMIIKNLMKVLINKNFSVCP
ncbi:MAG: NUDIX hydrolase [Bacteroidales bacterium]|jgi:8-oxo-dGTP diphosphatase|nr:NUDIX hydrolase [Bacteroidales bacterium]